jgi:hypothetical protein
METIPEKFQLGSRQESMRQQVGAAVQYFRGRLLPSAVSRCLFLICLLTAANQALSVSVCNESRPSGKCYRTNGSGEFWAYGEYSRQSQETLFADYVARDGFNLTRIIYKRQGSEFKYDRYVIQTKNKNLHLVKRDSFRSDVGVIKLPQGRISSCRGANSFCFVFERTAKDLYYGGKFRSSGAARRHGYGLLLTNEGELYVGYFRNDKAHGKGHLIFFNGEEYIGEFENGKFSGHGAFYYDSGKKYVGQWRDHRMQGQGSVFSNMGDLEWSGIWAGGRKQSENTVAARPAPVAKTTVSVEEQISPQTKKRLIALQRELINLGLLRGDPDGVPGPATKAAMRVLVAELPALLHGQLNAMSWTDYTDLGIALETLRAYIAVPSDQCPFSGYPYSICFNGID